jgi:tRNA/rRNA methyltransferase
VGDVEGLFTHLESAAVSSGFLDPEKPGRFMERMRRLFARARLERQEVKLLRGLLGALEKKKRS